MTVDYPDGKQKTRVTHDAEMEPVGLFANQRVTITLNFASRYAGDTVAVVPFDGGIVEPQSVITVPPNGKVTFAFEPRGTGAYRLLVVGSEKYALNLFARDPNAKPGAFARPAIKKAR